MGALTDEEIERELARIRSRKRQEGRVPSETGREGDILAEERRKKVASEGMLPVGLLVRQFLWRALSFATEVPWVHGWAVRKEVAAIRAVEEFYYQKVAVIEARRKAAGEAEERVEVERPKAVEEARPVPEVRDISHKDGGPEDGAARTVRREASGDFDPPSGRA